MGTEPSCTSGRPIILCRLKQIAYGRDKKKIDKNSVIAYGRDKKKSDKKKTPMAVTKRKFSESKKEYTGCQVQQKSQRFSAGAQPWYKQDPYKILDFDSVGT